MITLTITLLVWYLLGALGGWIYTRKVEPFPFSWIIFFAVTMTGPLGLIIAILSEKQKEIK